MSVPMILRKLLAAAVAAVAMGLSAPSLGQSCTPASGTLVFPPYVGTQVQSSTTFTMSCSKPGGPPIDVTFAVSLSTGSGTYLQRLLRNGALPSETLPYNLYRESLPPVLNTNVWGDGSGSTTRWVVTVRLPGASVVPVQTTLVGAIPSGHFPSAGSYQDIVIATVQIL